ncbi:hypothetical protein HDU77_011003 [Chytriomyces hyalinus]|nr:hypothetical protein HDU77_011003 [Chytriomyces hyalinus]
MRNLKKVAQLQVATMKQSQPIKQQLKHRKHLCNTITKEGYSAQDCDGHIVNPYRQPTVEEWLLIEQENQELNHNANVSQTFGHSDSAIDFKNDGTEPYDDDWEDIAEEEVVVVKECLGISLDSGKQQSTTYHDRCAQELLDMEAVADDILEELVQDDALTLEQPTDASLASVYTYQITRIVEFMHWSTLTIQSATV